MPKFRVLITDYAWANLDIERRVLAEIDAEIVLPGATDEQSLAKAATGVDAIMTNWAKTTATVIAAAPACQIVSRLGIGLDNIDVAYCTEHKIPVTNVPDYCLIEVAEHALALLLAQARKVAYYHHETQEGRYNLQAGAALRRIEGQTLGIIGYGAIGERLAVKAQALGLKVLATSRTRRELSHGVRWCELDELLRESDYISLHVPLTPDTKGMMGAREFALLKPSAYLINTARGGVIDHAALAEALARNQLAGAALDVQVPEPPDLTQAPYDDPRVIVTPHAAFVSLESLENLRQRAAKQVAVRLSGGVPENVVNPAVLSG
jgi:D-3-phosphoglycerate dehydrogenase / 2-oxoglutarate reductase